MNEVADYVAQVRIALADLPAAAREELLEDLPEHLAEVAAEGEGPLTERLGSPAVYAAELRAAAGVPAGGRHARVDARIRAVAGEIRARLQAIDAKAGPIAGTEKGSDVLRPLRPAWWVLRGYLLAMALAYMFATDEPIGLLPRFDVGDRNFTGILVLVVFVVASIWLGRRQSRLPRVPRLVLGIGTALLMLPALASIIRADDDAANYRPYESVSGVYDVVDSGVYHTVDSVYVFDEQGRPLVGARVFDQEGKQVPPGLWGCVDGSGVIIAEVVPKCADPRPLDWPGSVRTPMEREQPEVGGTPTPVPSATG